MARLKVVKQRKKLLYEIGVAVLMLTVLLGALSHISVSASTPIVTTDSLWKYASNITVTIEYRNTTDPGAGGQKLTYKLSDIGTFYNGTIYIAFNPPSGYERVRGVELVLVGSDGKPLTAQGMIDHGVGKVDIHVELIPSGTVDFPGTFATAILFGVGGWPPSLVTLASTPNDIFNANKTVANLTATLDPGSVAIKTLGRGNDPALIHLWLGDVGGVSGIKLHVEIYGVSKKPVLAIYAEPVYAVLTATVSALYAAARRIQQYAMSAFGGLGLATIFSGLTGSAIAAMVLGIAFFVVMVELRKKR